jgi:hypothetical protein
VKYLTVRECRGGNTCVHDVKTARSVPDSVHARRNRGVTRSSRGEGQAIRRVDVRAQAIVTLAGTVFIRPRPRSQWRAAIRQVQAGFISVVVRFQGAAARLRP